MFPERGGISVSHAAMHRMVAGSRGRGKRVRGGYVPLRARGRLTRQGGLDLLVDDDLDDHAPLGGGLEEVIEAVLFVGGRRAAEIELRAEPPVEDVYTLAGGWGSGGIVLVLVFQGRCYYHIVLRRCAQGPLFFFFLLLFFFFFFKGLFRPLSFPLHRLSTTSTFL